jgi:hypothetical protein
MNFMLNLAYEKSTNSPIFSIPYAPNWVSKILSIIWCSNTANSCIDTFKQKWSSWKLPHWAQLIDTLDPYLRRNDKSLDLQTPHSRSRAKAPLTHTARDQFDMEDNPSKLQHKMGNEKTKKDMGKWCKYHKIPWHNTDECRSKQSLMVELKAS